MVSLPVKALRRIVAFPLQKMGFVNVNYPVIFGDPGRISFGKNVHVYNAILNTNSGWIIIGDDVSILPNSILVTGTHDFSKRGLERRKTYPRTGRNIIIKKGAWIGAGALVLGNVTIGGKFRDWCRFCCHQRCGTKFSCCR
jgi:acetyltransferase-like isoleucine patch superfamily enzyme